MKTFNYVTKSQFLIDWTTFRLRGGNKDRSGKYKQYSICKNILVCEFLNVNRAQINEDTTDLGIVKSKKKSILTCSKGSINLYCTWFVNFEFYIFILIFPMFTLIQEAIYRWAVFYPQRFSWKQPLGKNAVWKKNVS